MRARAIVSGSGVNGVVHVGYRLWLMNLTQQLSCELDVQNRGEQVLFDVSGAPEDIRYILAQAHKGPPRARVLDVHIVTLEE